jgi:arabinan endo-1,5-alpha-L-arabinosidase
MGWVSFGGSARLARGISNRRRRPALCVLALTALTSIACDAAEQGSANLTAPGTPTSPRSSAGVRTFTPHNAGAFRNPVFGLDAPDPAVLAAADGAFYAYTTQSLYAGSLIHVPVLRSVDTVHWRFVGDALPTLPTWAQDEGDTWAPHVQLIDGTYVLYFSSRDVANDTMQIGGATSRAPSGPFTPFEAPLIDAEFERIDPQVMATERGLFLYWSQLNTVRVAKLSHDGTRVIGPTNTILSPIGHEGTGYDSVVEGAWAAEHGSWVYLFYSGDVCCGPDAHYAVMVARAPSPRGPFERFGGNPVVEQNDAFVAPGHVSMFTDREGRDWLVYHAIPRGGDGETRVMMLDALDWRRGWPVVNDGTGPSSKVVPAPRVTD